MFRIHLKYGNGHTRTFRGLTRAEANSAFMRAVGNASRTFIRNNGAGDPVYRTDRNSP